jgi:outer membrane protein assembly factor BamB
MTTRQQLRARSTCVAARIGLVLLTLFLAAGAIVLSTEASSAAGGTSTSPVTPVKPGDLLTYDYDNLRSGRDTVDPPIAALSAGPSWNDDSLSGAVYGEPLVYGATVYVATEHDVVYAVAARTGRVLWSLVVGSPVSLSVVDAAPTLGPQCGDIDPLGITGTPVIDPATNELFLTEETMLAGPATWQRVRHWMVAVSLTTRRELWHRDIDPPRPNTAGTYYIPAEQERPALTLLGGRVYAEFGGLDGDCGEYHGYVVDLRESGSGSLQSYEVPTVREGAIWETNGALVSPKGDLYVATGNGSSDTVAHFDEGNAVVELSPSLSRLGVWAPDNWVQLNDEDWDLGSAGPIQVPGTSLLFVAGKPASTGSFGYLMAETPLEGIGRGAYTGAVCTSGGAFGADASDVLGSGARARTMIYVPCGGGTVALEVSAAPMRFRRAWVASAGSPNGPPIVAGGVVWALNWSSGQLVGMNPSSGRVLLERPTEPVAHFATPGAGDGMIYVPTTSGVEAFSMVS